MINAIEKLWLGKYSPVSLMKGVQSVYLEITRFYLFLAHLWVERSLPNLSSFPVWAFMQQKEQDRVET